MSVDISIDADSIRLRTIAAAVMNGDCPRDEYLVERRRLIDLHTGETTPDLPVVPLDESAFVPRDTDTRPVPVVTIDEKEAAPVTTGSSARHYDLLIGIGVLVAVLGVLWGLLALFW